MKINKIIVENYKSLKSTQVEFRDEISIIVGDNEVGKTSLVEALNIGLTAQLDGRHIGYELHPYLFNMDCATAFLKALAAGEKIVPPSINIELYFDVHEDLEHLKGSINTLSEDCPGAKLSIEFDEKYSDEYSDYIADPGQVTSIPVEYLKVVWRSFSDQELTARSMPFKSTMIDASNVRHNLGANRYVIDVMSNYLSTHDQARLALSYRKMKNNFLEDPSIADINAELEKKTGEISDKKVSIALDNTARARWEAGVMPHLNEIPFPLVGKGEQSSTKIKLALAGAGAPRALLVEEPENHLSHSNLSALLAIMAEKSELNQMIVTTHSSFVLNKLGVSSVIFFDGETGATLSDLSPDTKDYFMKLAGHDTLRFILAKRVVLVEGPSDELVVQKAYLQTHGKMPLADGAEVITVNSLAFKRFLEIASLLRIDTRVVTDNDGDVAKVQAKYQDFDEVENISIYYDADEDAPTLEPQLVKYNGRNKVNEILGKDFDTDDELLTFMQGNKTECALKFFEYDQEIAIPEYIENAVKK